MLSIPPGFTDSEALRKQVLFDLVLDTFKNVSDDSPDLALWVPGRLEIFGKHTDYGGGHTLIAPVPRGFVLVGRRRQDGVIALHDASRREHFLVDAKAGTAGCHPVPTGGPADLRTSGPADLRTGGPADPRTGGPADPRTTAPTGWRRYALTVVRRLAKNFPGAALGADLAFGSDLAPASGMSSSSALMIAVAAALVRLAAIDKRAEWQANISGQAGAAGYFACIENGMAFGSLDGDAGVGTHGGSEDHIAIVCGKPDHAAAWRFVPPVHEADVRVPEDWQFVIASSGVAARKTGEARDSYNNLSLAVRALLEIWNAHEAAAPSLYAALTSAPDAAERLHARLHEHPAAASLNLPARLTQFVNEDARAVEAARAMRDGDGSTLASLAQESQRDAEQFLRNQTPETSALVALARRLGAFAASSFGAGFGGSVWALVGKEEATGLLSRWLSEYRSRYPGREATAFEARPGPPLSVIR
jgi:galactokinase